jgi:hypothetical protein
MKKSLAIAVAVAAVWLSGSAAYSSPDCAEKFFACGNVCEAGEASARPKCIAACQVEGEKCSLAATAAERIRRINQRPLPVDRHGTMRTENSNLH